MSADACSRSDKTVYNMMKAVPLQFLTGCLVPKLTAGHGINA